jgi:hypothetical protein
MVSDGVKLYTPLRGGVEFFMGKMDLAGVIFFMGKMD